MLQGDKVKKRMKSVSEARDTMRQDRLKNLNQEARLRADGKGVAKNMVNRFSLEKLLEASDLKDKLAQAGLRGQAPVYKFYLFRLILPIVGLAFGLIFFIILNVSSWYSFLQSE
jgi:tight adherence protein C